MAKKTATGRTDAVTVRLSQKTLAQIDRWRRSHGGTRAEAVQQLVKQALEADPTQPKTQKAAGAAKAADLAEQAIDRQADPSADPGEHARRKEDLIKGPPELRRARRAE